MRDLGGAGNRAVLISDLHLGSYRCNARGVLSFLRSHASETLYLVGDIVDLWSLGQGATLPADHLAVIRHILGLARNGTRVVMVPGNHDWDLLALAKFGLDGLEVRAQACHVTADGRRLLLVHGHEQDPILGSTHPLAGLFYSIGEQFGEALLRGWRRPPAATRALPSRFELDVAAVARANGFDGVVCGHSHAPADRLIDGVRYLNCGDWVRNHTGIVERADGQMQLVRWSTVSEAADDVPVFADAAGVAS